MLEQLAVLKDIFCVSIPQLLLLCFLLSGTLLLDVPPSQQALALFTGCCSKSLIN